MTSVDIRNIHIKKLAKPNFNYIDDKGNIYIGLENGSLKLLNKGANTTFKQIENIKENNVQKAIERVQDNLEAFENTTNTSITNINTAIDELECLSIVMSLVL